MATSSSPQDRILLSTRVVSAIIAPFLVLAFLVLFPWPGDTKRLFAWEIKPTMSPMVLGSVYIGGAYFFIRTVRSSQWHTVAGGFPPVATFASLMGITTVLHWNRFIHGNVAFWLWVGLYFTTPFVVFAVFFVNRREHASNSDHELELPQSAAVAMVVAGGVSALTSAFLFLFPHRAIDIWPWHITPLTARMLGAIFALGLAGLGALRERRWSAVRILLQVAGIMLILILIAGVRAREEFDRIQRPDLDIRLRLWHDSVVTSGSLSQDGVPRAPVESFRRGAGSARRRSSSDAVTDEISRPRCRELRGTESRRRVSLVVSPAAQHTERCGDVISIRSAKRRGPSVSWRQVNLRVALLVPLVPAAGLATVLTWVLPFHIAGQTFTAESVFLTTFLACWASVALVLLFVRDDRLYQQVWTQRRLDRPQYDYAQLWTGSPEFEGYRRRRFLSWLSIAMAVALGASAVALASGEMLPVGRRHGFAALLAVGAVLLFAESIVPYASSRRAFLERLQFEKSAEVRAALSNIHGTVEFSTVFDLNRKQLDEYHVLTIRHAQASFRNAQIATAVGFSVLVAGVVLALQASDTSSKIAVSSLSAIATLLSGYISKTFFVSNQKAMRDLSAYYKQPLETSRLLAAERLVREPELLKDPAGTLVELMITRLLAETGTSPNGVKSLKQSAES